ncbi:glycine--tRNA ligase subunit beta [Phenylobacterium sp.]|uniref:glycine--tRNA ligase subunit beta n=1 Tax=Phenylobacterium sp. TaxID=1871053 RepID=UPI002737D60E|nr:glycine--tRNA ligase subunit beta [Phenylobacterium sp.]MDP3869418.1 glycine--tRNA ligase subunit beta [Phenylobacterium sp.]
MPQLLVELFSEEIPARMQAQAARDLERMAREHLAAEGLLPEGLKTFAGARRLTLVADGLPAAQGDRHEDLKGPRVGSPDQAIEGFLRKAGIARDQLVEKDGLWFAHIHRAGRPTPEIVAEMVDKIVRNFPWPKSMTWGRGTLRWVRPLKRIVCLFDGEVVPFFIDGIASGDVTEGHRFMGSGKPFKVKDFDSYRDKLASHFVVLDPEERKDKIMDGARTLCFARNLELVEDEGLLTEVAGLAEWPTPVLGDMDPAFLDLPPEVIRTSMRTHQKYFAVRDPRSGKLAPHFLTVANIEAADGGKEIARGNAKVLSARLNDARFFWDEDRKTKLEDRLQKLTGVTFHAKLGTMYERVERIEALARELAPLLGASEDQAACAARVAKADLATGMVGEFPELQGVMGGYYALAEGLSVDIADAVNSHYRPQGPQDEVPRGRVALTVALADKIDTLVGFFAIDEKPTGSRDPYALRRAAIGVIRIVLETGSRLALKPILAAHDERIQLKDPAAKSASGIQFGVARFRVIKDGASQEVHDLLEFLADRLKVVLRDQGKRHDLVDAVFALGDDDLVRIVAKVQALDSFLTTEDGVNLLAGYKRAGNILRAEEKKGPLPAGPSIAVPTAPAEEGALIKALDRIEPLVSRALGAEDYSAAMRALSEIRAPVDAFFEGVLVNSDVSAERENRLRLLAQVRDLMGRVADFSQVNG